MKKTLLGLTLILSLPVFSVVPQLGTFEGSSSNGDCDIKITKTQYGPEGIEIYQAVTNYDTDVMFALNNRYIIDSENKIVYTNHFSGESYPVETGPSYYLSLTLDDNGRPVNMGFTTIKYKREWSVPFGAPKSVEKTNKCEFLVSALSPGSKRWDLME